MANIASSKKDARRSAVRAVRNRGIRSAVKTKINRFRRALADRSSSEQAEPLAVNAVSALDRAASKGVLHPNNTARRKSRLMNKLNQAGEATPEAASSRSAGSSRKPRGSQR